MKINLFSRHGLFVWVNGSILLNKHCSDCGCHPSYLINGMLCSNMFSASLYLMKIRMFCSSQGKHFTYHFISKLKKKKSHLQRYLKICNQNKIGLGCFPIFYWEWFLVSYSSWAHQCPLSVMTVCPRVWNQSAMDLILWNFN